ncbi:hypothetical protein FH972_022973 [Carpinus fangiana]|uniref:SH3 domain-containing protein n=1 Tax=Carpinus fangiana TaxID=176857 RepID=A0A5N6KTU3_9ROSI|nr:hypothetical protein FH972_022973 [Carpinus fangiana]
MRPFRISNPFPMGAKSECKKCGQILASFVDPRQAFGPDKIIPPQILANAKGIAVITVFKAGFLGAAGFGSGMVVARLADGSWSAPSAIGTVRGGVGGQIGFELTDFVFILNDAMAVKTFAQAGSITLGGNVSIAAGPVGRNAEAAGAASLRSVAGIFAYSKTKGLFAGVSLEGSVIIERRDANEKLYGRRVKAADALQGAVPVPPAAEPMMRVLNSRVFAGVAGAASATDSMYNDIPIYDDSHEDVVWQGRTGSAYNEGVRTNRTGSVSQADDYEYRDRPARSSTWSDDIYDREPAPVGRARSYSSRANPSETFDRLQSSSTGAVGDDYVYSDKPKPGRPTAPKPIFAQKTAASSLGPDQAIAKFTFEPDQEGDLGFKKGEIITITKRTDNAADWWEGRIGSRTGVFPRTRIGDDTPMSQRAASPDCRTCRAYQGLPRPGTAKAGALAWRSRLNKAESRSLSNLGELPRTPWHDVMRSGRPELSRPACAGPAHVRVCFASETTGPGHPTFLCPLPSSTLLPHPFASTYPFTMSARIAFSRIGARSLLASSRTYATRAAFKPQQGQVAAQTADKRNISVVSFDENGQRTQEEIVESPDQKGPVNPEGVDEEAIAYPLKSQIIDQLTPTMKRFTLGGKVAVITGAGRGLGLNMAQALVEAGVQGLAILDVQKDLGEKAARDLSEQAGVDARFYPIDVRDAEAVANSVQDVVNHYGKIDVLINAAGIADSNQPAVRYDPVRFRRQVDINVTGTFLVAQACGQHMIASKNGGSMIFIASMSGGIVNYPQEQSCYNASKAAVIQLGKSLATEWARYGIRVNTISPGYMDTALNRVPALDAQKKIWVDNTPQKRLGAVNDLNNLAVYLASDGSSFMTGSNCLIDGLGIGTVSPQTGLHFDTGKLVVSLGQAMVRLELERVWERGTGRTAHEQHGRRIEYMLDPGLLSTRRHFKHCEYGHDRQRRIWYVSSGESCARVKKSRAYSLFVREQGALRMPHCLLLWQIRILVGYGEIDTWARFDSRPVRMDVIVSTFLFPCSSCGYFSCIFLGRGVHTEWALQLGPCASHPPRASHASMPTKNERASDDSTSPNSGGQRPANRSGGNRRARKACDRCNQLRARCDGGEPCARCLQSQSGCEYARVMKKRGKPSKVELARRAALRAAETELRASRVAPSSAPSFPDPVMQSFAIENPLDHQPKSAEVEVPGSDIHDNYSDLRDLPSLDKVLPGLIRPNGPHRESPQDDFFNEKSFEQHNRASLQNIDLKYPVLLPLVPYLVSVIPLSFACELLEYYFSSSSIVCPHPNSPYVIGFMFSKHSFLAETPPRLYSPALLASMLWIASRTSDAIYFDESPSVRERVSRKLLNLTIRLLQPLIHGPIPRGLFDHGIAESIEGEALLGARGRGSNETLDDVATYVHIGTVVSASEYKSSSLRWWNAAWALAVEQELYNELPPREATEQDHQKGPAEIAAAQIRDEVEREERRRVWWLLFLIDRHLSFCYNKPLSLSDRDCRNLLQPIDEYRWQNGNLAVAPINDPSQPITMHRPRQKGPPTEFGGPYLFGYYLPLMVILGEVIELIHARNHPRLGQAFVNATLWDEQVRAINIRLTAFEQSMRLYEAEETELVHSAQHLQPSGYFDTRRASSGTVGSGDGPDHLSRRTLHKQIQLKKAIAYSTYVVHVLHNLLIGKCDPISLFDDQDYWISSPSFVDATGHAILAADAIAEILEYDPDISTIPWLFGIELLHGSFLLLLIIDKLKTDAAPNVVRAGEVMVRAHEACAFTLNTEYQRKFRKVMRSAIAEARGYAPDEAGDEQKRRREVLGLYRWTGDGTGSPGNSITVLVWGCLYTPRDDLRRSTPSRARTTLSLRHAPARKAAREHGDTNHHGPAGNLAEAPQQVRHRQQQPEARHPAVKRMQHALVVRLLQVQLAGVHLGDIGSGDGGGVEGEDLDRRLVGARAARLRQQQHPQRGHVGGKGAAQDLLGVAVGLREAWRRDVAGEERDALVPRHVGAVAAPVARLVAAREVQQPGLGRVVRRLRAGVAQRRLPVLQRHVDWASAYQPLRRSARGICSCAVAPRARVEAARTVEMRMVPACCKGRWSRVCRGRVGVPEDRAGSSLCGKACGGDSSVQRMSMRLSWKADLDAVNLANGRPQPVTVTTGSSNDHLSASLSTSTGALDAVVFKYTEQQTLRGATTQFASTLTTAIGPLNRPPSKLPNELVAVVGLLFVSCGQHATVSLTEALTVALAVGAKHISNEIAAVAAGGDLVVAARNSASIACEDESFRGYFCAYQRDHRGNDGDLGEHGMLHRLDTMQGPAPRTMLIGSTSYLDKDDPCLGSESIRYLVSDRSRRDYLSAHLVNCAAQGDIASEALTICTPRLRQTPVTCAVAIVASEMAENTA